MRIKIIAVGKIKEKSLQQGIDEFLKRITPFAVMEIVQLKDEGKEKESARIIKELDNNTYILDAEGKQFSSEEFADFLKQNRDEKITFVIGGPEGFTDELKKKAKRISLSKMTFTHELARLLLAEQIYRACMINNNRKYYNK